MRHKVKGRKLRRPTAHRLALLRNLVTSFLEKERVRTTLAKAKEARPLAEKMITLGKKGTLHARRQVMAFVRKEAVVTKVFEDLGARFGQRPGGYSRIIKLGRREGDGAPLAMLELVGSEFKKKAKKKKKDKGKPVKKSK
jgi:large subunit ribosomal protein L17